MKLRILKGTIADVAEWGWGHGYGGGYGYGDVGGGGNGNGRSNLSEAGMEPCN